MTEFTAIVDSQITLPKLGVPENILEEIRGALMMKNPAQLAAKKEQIGGWWNIPDYVDLYTENVYNMTLPRGFANQLVAGFNHYGLEVAFDDRRASNPSRMENRRVDVRDYQDRAIESMLACEQGVWESPPGSGKTVAILETIRRSRERSLVITDKTNIAEQWRSRAKFFLGADIGLFGDGSDDQQDITVALQQSLWSKREELKESGWFDQWGFVCLDECHHLPANTFTEILSLFPAKYRIGVSGTPYKKPGQDDLIWATLGPRIHLTDKHKLRKGGWLIKPEVKIWNTGFKTDFWPTHQCDPKKGCMFKYCTRDKKKRRHQNNYAEVMTELIADDVRNELIAHNIAREVADGHCVIVLSKRLAHLDKLKKLTGGYLGNDSDLYSFTGRETTNRRLEIQDRAEHGRCALFSTIADEALDIPRIDRVHLAWPTRNTGTTSQQIGRAERPHPAKKDAIVNDYYDNVGPLRGQISDRVNFVYIPEGLTIRGWEEVV